MLALKKRTPDNPIAIEGEKYLKSKPQKEVTPLVTDEKNEKTHTQQVLRTQMHQLNISDANFSKIDMIQLLSLFEAEVQARDEVIHILKQNEFNNEKSQNGLKSNHPLRALLRDSNRLNSSSTTNTGNQYQSNDVYLYSIKQRYTESYEKLKYMYYALEEKYKMLLEDVGKERQKHQEFREKSIHLVKTLEDDREKMHKTLQENCSSESSEEEISLPSVQREGVRRLKKFRRSDKTELSSNFVRKNMKKYEENGTEALIKEVEILRSTVSAMKKTENTTKEVEMKSSELFSALKNEMKQTQVLREELDRLRKNAVDRKEIVNITEETMLRFDTIQQAFEGECKKQSTMELQIQDFKQKLEMMTEMEIVLKSSESKIIQLQTTLRETKNEKNNLMKELQEERKQKKELESKLQREFEKNEINFKTTKTNKTEDLTDKLLQYEENCSTEIKLFQSKLNETDVFEIVSQTESDQLEALVCNLKKQIAKLRKKLGSSVAQDNRLQLKTEEQQELLRSTEKLDQLLSTNAYEVLAVLEPKQFNKNNSKLHKKSHSIQNDEINNITAKTISRKTSNASITTDDSNHNTKTKTNQSMPKPRLHKTNSCDGLKPPIHDRVTSRYVTRKQIRTVKSIEDKIAETKNEKLSADKSKLSHPSSIVKQKKNIDTKEIHWSRRPTNPLIFAKSTKATSNHSSASSSIQHATRTNSSRNLLGNQSYQKASKLTNVTKPPEPSYLLKRSVTPLRIAHSKAFSKNAAASSSINRSNSFGTTTNFKTDKVELKDRFSSEFSRLKLTKSKTYQSILTKPK